MKSIFARRRHAAAMLVPALAAVLFSAACAMETAPRFVPSAHDIEGTWRLTPAFPGNGFTMGLIESSGAVTGGGDFTGEVGPFGTLVVSGNATADSVHLQIVFNYDPRFTGLHPDTAQLNGALVTLDSLTGTLTRGGTTSATQYIRLNIGQQAR